MFCLRPLWPALGLPECLITSHYLHIRQVFAPPNAGKLKIALLPAGPVIGGGTAGFDKLHALANCHPLSLSTDCLASPALPFPADFHWAEPCVEPRTFLRELGPGVWAEPLPCWVVTLDLPHFLWACEHIFLAEAFLLPPECPFLLNGSFLRLFTRLLCPAVLGLLFQVLGA